MKLIDWNDDNIYDVVIVNDYRSVLISSNVPALSYISDKFGTAIGFSDYDTVEIYIQSPVGMKCLKLEYQK